MKKLVLAYSGGLDTSYCAHMLSHKEGYEVHAVTVNTGGFDKEQLAGIEERALELGASTYTAIDAVQSFYDRVVKYLIFGNVLRNNTYPLSVSAERIVQALEIVEYARGVGATHIAHGSTGAGNDQVRFDLIFQVIAPEIEIITPIRDQQLSREAEIAYLQENGITYSWEKAKYSINQGLWGTSVGGVETLGSREALPEAAYPSQLSETQPRDISLTFEKGELTAVDGKPGTPVENIRLLESIASAYAIGRDIHVGDTIIGIKGRVGFEAASALITIKAHHLLEKHTLSKWQQFQKEQLANFYGMLLHEGQYLDEVMRNLEAFLADTQRHVSGEVFVTLHPYRFELRGIESDNDLMNASFGSYGEMNKGWTAAEAKGFIKILSNPGKIARKIQEK
ncbi:MULTISPECIES: argininosuccinate synthase [unclassified Robiginitalea]|mgnify:CR=1 FL=1|uniref:argininosuccinate synthase n=1 Tax=Robiginitalea TaxID=252306 RepID=UPI00234BFD53|nr:MULTISPECIES: argininosuccinate synthase domain-containing protein [unclassified Robiginitalea]MDC6352827.1 argininosuccinate synthase [Robiginitalea sp. PM2]MDC6374007.1 argininosuccinate synthase [Robiginitalea sp. SP8]